MDKDNSGGAFRDVWPKTEEPKRDLFSTGLTIPSPPEQPL